MESSGLRRNRTFVRWATAELVNVLGSQVSAVVLPILVFQRTGSDLSTGVIAAVRVVPYLLFGLVAGPVADHYDRKRLMVVALVAQGLSIAAIPLVDLSGSLPVVVVFAASFLSATAFVFGDAAAFGVLPQLVPPSQLPAANGALSSLSSASAVAGPALGGVLVGVVGAVSAIWIDVASFMICALVIAGLTVPAHAVTAARLSLRMHTSRAFGFIRRERTIGTLIGVGFLNSLAFGVQVALLVPYAVEQLDRSKDSGWISALFVADAVGALLSGLLFSRLFAVGRIRFITPTCLLLGGGLLLAMGETTSLPLALLVVAALSLVVATTITTGITYRQLATPAELSSSVNVVGRMVSWGGQPFGALLGGIVADVAGVDTALVVAAAVMGAAGVAAGGLLRSVAPTRPS